MKNMIRGLYLALTMLLLSASITTAQTTIAYIDAEAIIQEMPEFKKARIDVEAHAKQLQKSLEGKQEKLKAFALDYAQKKQQGVLSPKQEYEMDSTYKVMNAELQKETQNAQQNLAKKENTLMTPVYEKFNSTLKTVATEKKWSYIADKKLFLYLEGGVDATTDVKSKLGL